jgi:hypothetical protein
VRGRLSRIFTHGQSVGFVKSRKTCYIMINSD